MARSSLLAILTLVVSLLAWQPQAHAQAQQLLPPGDIGRPPADWAVPTAGWEASWTDESGTAMVRLRLTGERQGPFGNFMRSIDATPYRGRSVTLDAKVLVESAGGRAQMWLRVDRPNRQIGAFDNMGDRPISPGFWTAARIRVDVDPDAEWLALGVMSIGSASVLITDVTLTPGPELKAQEPSRPQPLDEQRLTNLVAASRALALVRFFHPSTEATSVKSWDHVAVALMERAERADTPSGLAAALRDVLAPLAPGLVIGTDGAAIPELPLPENATHVLHWRHNGAGTVATRAGGGVYSSTVVRTPLADLTDDMLATRVIVQDLGAGVWCALPRLVPADSLATLPRAALPNPWSNEHDAVRLTATNRATRFAAVATLWGVMQHFYPYFDAPPYDGSTIDWEGELRRGLLNAATDADEVAFERSLRIMLARLYDGHGSIRGPGSRFGSTMPLALAWAGNDLVVSGKGESAPPEITIGDALLSINERPLSEWVLQVSAEISGATDGWVRHLVASQLPRSPFESPDATDPCRAEFQRPDGTRYEALVASASLDRIEEPAFERPANGTELLPGIRYFDLNAAENAALTEAMPALAQADGIVFDLRGYPGSAAYKLMEHLIDGPATSAQWNVPIVTRPDGEGWEWNTGGRWQLKPAKPRLTAQIAFVTDGRAISYAESIMGIVEAYELGEIVGATTAGTNGNVNPITLPGGFVVSWTGMKVLKHDGSRHHGIGIRPTVPVSPTASGIAAGRDEVLERAVEILKARISDSAARGDAEAADSP